MFLAEIFNDNMILQREKPICFFGYGKGEAIIELCGKSYNFTSEADNFRFYLPPMEAGGPFDITVTLNGVKRIIKNILIGDVYIAAGQSNIEFTLKDTAEIEYFDNQSIRFFTEPNSVDEQNNHIHNSPDWIICNGNNADNFSAIGYYFADYLHKSVNVAIGIISCSKGASRVDSWTSPDLVQEESYQKMISVRHNDYYVYQFNHGSWLYKNKLLNIAAFAVSGVLWYQGESNRCHDEGVHYARLLEIMINNWRELWHDNLPFYCVQLMPYKENEEIADWAIIRSQQELASKIIDNVYLVTLVDTCESDEIHPINKKSVSYALANAVKSVQFGIKAEYCGPVLNTYKPIKNGIELSFTHADGLCIMGDTLRDTCLYDITESPVEFQYEIADNCLRLFFDCKNPKRISMGYRNAPEHNLYNGAGLLASPFNLIIDNKKRNLNVRNFKAEK